MWIVISIVLLITAAIIISYFTSINTNTKKGEEFHPFEASFIAHRGFFDNASNCPENSIAAFSRAVENNYGIELDVQLTLDKKAVVFHDDDLLRMCGVQKKVSDCTLEELKQYHLLKSEEKIPLLIDVLQIIGGKVPLIVEIKNSDMWRETCEIAAGILDEYKGCYCVESFSPFVVEWYRKNRPQIVRGQLSTDFFEDEPQMSFIRKFVLTNLLMNGRAKPDFIAYNHKHKNKFSYKLLRNFSNVKNVAWTVKSQQELNDARDVFTCMIFDSFTPEE